jgi:hypothetical protein
MNCVRCSKKTKEGPLCKDCLSWLNNAVVNLPSWNNTLTDTDTLTYADEAERNFRWAYKLLVAFAQTLFQVANLQDGDDREWNGLVGSSQSAFLHEARRLARIDDEAFLSVVRSGRYEVDDIYDTLFVDEDSLDAKKPDSFMLSEVTERLNKINSELTEQLRHINRFIKWYLKQAIEVLNHDEDQSSE